MEQSSSIYPELAGGPDLLHWFGQVPSFADAEILSLHLSREGPSVLRLHGWISTGNVGRNGAPVLDRHAVVTFTLTEVKDVQLEGFSIQNVIGGLRLRRAPDRPERRGYFIPHPNDVEIELESCYGLFGLIRAHSIAITFQHGEPDESDA